MLAHADDALGHAVAFSGARGLMPVRGLAEAELPAWQPAQPMTLQIANPQAWIASYDVAVRSGVAGIALGTWAGSADAATAAKPFTVPIPADGFVDQLGLDLAAEGLEPVSGLKPASELDYAAAPAATVTVDAGALPPRIMRVDLGGTPARPQVSGQTERPYAAAAAVAHLSWTGARTVGSWVLVGPALAPLAAPPLPAAVAPSLPGADVAVASLVLEDRSDAPSYHDWLARTHGQVSERAPTRLGHARAGP